MAERIDIGGRLHSTETGNVVAGANEIYDDAKGKKQSVVNQETDAALDDRYTKSQTYNKTELNSMITTPNQEYVSVTATDQTTAATDVLPATGAADKVYRVGNWDGTQFDATCYSEYAWKGDAYIHLSTKPQIGEVFDISAYHATGGTLATYANLSAALDSNNGGGVPQSLQKGGMSVKFVQSSDNKYVQYRCMAQNFTTDVTQWQGVDEKPSAGSNNLVTSNGIELMRLEYGSSVLFQNLPPEDYNIKINIVQGREYKVTNTGTNGYSCFLRDSSKANIQTIAAVLSAGASATFVANADGVYIGGYGPGTKKLAIQDLTYYKQVVRTESQSLSSSQKETARENLGIPSFSNEKPVLESSSLITSGGAAIGDNILKADLYNLLGEPVNLVAGEAGSYCLYFPFKQSGKYKVTNNATAGSSLYLYDAEKTQVQTITTLGANQSYEFTANQDAYYIGGYVDGQLGNLTLVGLDTESINKNINDLNKNKLSTKSILTNVDLVFNDGYLSYTGNPVVSHDSPDTKQYSNPVYVPKGSVILINTSSDKNFVTLASTNSAGSSYNALAWTAQAVTSLTAYTYTMLEDSYISVCGMISDLNVRIYRTGDYENKLNINNELSLPEQCVATVTGTKYLLYPFVKGKRYRITNKSSYSCSCYLRSTPSGASNQSVGNLDVNIPVEIVANENWNYIGGYNDRDKYNVEIVSLDSGLNVDFSINRLPDYYYDYINQKINTINRLLVNGGGRCDSFIFITDTHVYQSTLVCAPVINKLFTDTNVRKIIHGGDSCSVSSSSDAINGWNQIYDSFNKFNRFVAGVEKGRCVFLNVLGNHDFNDRISGNTFDGIDLQSRRNYIMATSDNNIVFNNNDDTGCYYYYDDKLSQLRYIILDTSYGYKDGDIRIGSTQLSWFFDTLESMPSGYDIVVINHVPTSTVLAGEASPSITDINKVLDVITAINNNDSVVIDGVTHDYSDYDHKVLFELAGHIHIDAEIYTDNVLNIVTINNGNGRASLNTSYNFFENGGLTKVYGTPSEQALDVFIISDDMINIVRVGAGGDRYFHKNKITISEGTIDLSSEIKHITPTSWMSCNPKDITGTSSGEVITWNYPNTKINVSNSGVVSLYTGDDATTGDAMVIAMDDNLNKEFFYVVRT